MNCSRPGCDAPVQADLFGFGPAREYCSDWCQKRRLRPMKEAERESRAPQPWEVVLTTDRLLRTAMAFRELRLNLERNVLGKGVGW